MGMDSQGDAQKRNDCRARGQPDTQLESGLGLRRGSARVFPDEQRADRFTLRVIESDPHANPIPWPGTFSRSITQPIELGLAEDGQPARISILRRNVLIGGMTGAGKSVILNIIIAALIRCLDVELWGVDLKGGMELAPWARHMRKLATTPEEADQLFRDAVTELNKRAERKAAEGRKVWDPARHEPAIVIIVDEYAELTDESHDCADPIARRGRAVAVNLIAATQRPTQQAMGRQAVRSQMDVRICLRVRERRDADLVLGQGAYLAGWHPHTLTQPGTFLVSDPEHTTPQRYRAYLITEDQITRHAAQTAATHAELAQRGSDVTQAAPEPSEGSDSGPGDADGQAAPDQALQDALNAAGQDGASIAELLAATGMSGQPCTGTFTPASGPAGPSRPGAGAGAPSRHDLATAPAAMRPEGRPAVTDSHQQTVRVCLTPRVRLRA